MLAKRDLSLQPGGEVDVKQAFVSRTTPEVVRAALIFKLCQMPVIVKNSSKLIDASYNVLGDSVTNKLLKATFFGHFCGGEDGESIKTVINKLHAEGIGAILDYAAEADVEDPRDLDGVPQSKVTARTYDYEGEAECDLNAEIALQSIRDAAGSSKDGFSAIKLTAMGKPDLLAHMSSILTDARHIFMSLDGPNLNRVKQSPLEKRIHYNILRDGVMNAGVELSDSDMEALLKEIDQECDGVIDYLDWLSFVNPMDLTMGPLTQFFRVDPLSDHQKTQLSNMINRLEKLALTAAECKVRLMIDAEQTYMQPAIDHLVLNLQRKYNREQPIIFNTFQCYLRNSSDRIRLDLLRAEREGFKFACKLVRGAYMIQERKRARDMGYRDPIYSSIQETHDNYNEMIKLLLDHNHMASFMVASHNEESVRLTTTWMEERGISKESGGIYFGQLLGMCDHVSFSLGHDKYGVYKYVPYGPVKEVVPYLVRRAEENSDMMKGASKEIKLLHRELKRRFLKR